MEYEKESIIVDIPDKDKNLQLIQNIIVTRNDLRKAHINFDFAEDELVDFYTYQIKALQSKLDYLTRLAKLKNIEFDLLDEKAI